MKRGIRPQLCAMVAVMVVACHATGACAAAAAGIAGSVPPDAAIVHATRAELAATLANTPVADTLGRADLLLQAGDPEGVLRLLARDARRPAETAARLVETARRPFGIRLRLAQALAAHGDFAQARRAVATLSAEAPDDPAVVRLRTRVWLATDDLAHLDSTSAAGLARGDTTARPAYLGARGALMRALLRWPEADSLFRLARVAARDPRDRAAAFAGAAAVRFQNRDYAGAVAVYDSALTLRPIGSATLVGLVDALVRLGKVHDAIALLGEAVRLDPWSEDVHYWLGNGYTDVNYAQLPARVPGAFPAAADSLTTRTLRGFRLQLVAGDDIETSLRGFAATHPTLAEPWSLLGSLLWTQHRSDDAVAAYRESLRRCPLYGRAHNGLAKALEQKRLAADVHAATAESAFAVAPMPHIAGLDSFVINWQALSPRIQKRVALSVEPWAAFIPVLVASGATFYIKPLYEILSECPHLESLRDQRIDYDSRLWDDVRGCGGHHTVTGAEDVERTVLGRYNTVLHELTHQVHGVFPPTELRGVETDYANAKARQAAGVDAFVSRYQASSVYEYFAEGMNSFSTPRRDAYDTRDITFERIVARDTALVHLIDHYTHVHDVTSYYAPALTASAANDLSDGKPNDAIRKLDAAMQRGAHDEATLTTMATAQLYNSAPGEARRVGAQATTEYPQSADAAVAEADAAYLQDGDLASSLEILTRAATRITGDDHFKIDLALAQTNLKAGYLDDAIGCAQRARTRQADDPTALWLIGEAEALAGRIDSARAAFRAALAVRSGIVDLRLAYAGALLRGGDLAAADSQIAEATLLAPELYTVKTYTAWSDYTHGHAIEAGKALHDIVRNSSWFDTAILLRALCWIDSGVNAEAATENCVQFVRRGRVHLPPRYKYIKETSSWVMVGEATASDLTLAYQGLIRGYEKSGKAAEAAEARGALRTLLHYTK